MKIGILTLPFNNNYGGYLQAFALMTILRNQGHEVELIYRKHNRRSLRWRIEKTVKNIIKILLGRKVWSLVPNQEKELRAQGALMMPFVDKFINNRSKPLYSSRELKAYVKNRFDAIVVGSDQVWRPEYVPDIEDYFLTFLDDDTRKISYAASFGSDSPIFTKTQKEECGKGIRMFNRVSVRELDGQDIIAEYGWIVRDNVSIVLDPTFLLSKEFYMQLVSKEESSFKGKMFCYVLDNSNLVSQTINIISESNGLEPISFYNCSKNKGEKILPPIEDWIRGFRDSDFVVTDSFHGTVFSIIFNKPFVTCVNSYRGTSRLKYLLSLFNLSNLLIDDISRIGSINELYINWNLVNSILDRERKASMSFLCNSLR